MARSYKVWLIQFEDDKELYVIANGLSQILYSDELQEYDIDTIEKIQLIEFADEFSKDIYDNIIDLHPKY